MQALERAIKALGSEAALASAIGVATSTPAMWKKRAKVPAEYCPVIERAVRAVAAEKGVEPVTCEQLRPDVAWEVLRLQATDQPAAVGG